MTTSPEGTGAGWFADPLGAPGALRCWDGAAWTSRVVLAGGDGLSVSWRVDLASLPAPDPAPSSEAPLVDTEATPASEVLPMSVELGPIELAPIRFAIEMAPVESAPIAPAPIRIAIEPEPIAPAPIRVAIGTPPVETPVETAADDASVVPSIGAVDPLVAAFGDDARWVAEAERSEPGAVRRRLVPVLAAMAIVALAAGASASLIDSNDRPEVEAATSYRDAAAGFALRYPDAWKVDDKQPGESIRFTVSAPGAPPTLTNTVSVVVGPEPSNLPVLDELADEVTNRLREQFPGIRLEEASRTTLLGAPALHLQLADVNDSPPLRIEQVVGRTTTGRPLSVTITVREPRTAPTPQQLRTFTDSITPA